MESLASALRTLGARVELQESPAPVAGDVFVIDSYRTNADEVARHANCALVAVDDLGRDMAVDLLVDPNPGPRPPSPLAARLLLGPEYALLDPRLRATPTTPVGDTVHKVLVTMGATDADGVGANLADAILRSLPAVEVRLVVGPWGEQRVPPGVQPVTATEGLGPWLADTDVVVTAAGVSLLEALALGRPTITVVTAPNQHRAATGAAKAGAAILAAPEQVTRELLRLTSGVEVRRTLRRNAERFVDGNGSQRVAEAILVLA